MIFVHICYFKLLFFSFCDTAWCHCVQGGVFVHQDSGVSLSVMPELSSRAVKSKTQCFQKLICIVYVFIFSKVGDNKKDKTTYEVDDIQLK